MFLPDSSRNPPTSVRGLHCKHFEVVMSELLLRIHPFFVRIPPEPAPNWPWDGLPHESAPPAGVKGQRKKLQLQSLMQCIVAMVPVDPGSIKIVDFGGGSGHLSIPLALLLPQCEVIVVDLKASSLSLVHEKAAKNTNPEASDDVFSYPEGVDVTQHDHTKRSCAGIPNLYTYHGSIESYEDKFDLGVALHACGEASDLVLRACGKAMAAVVMAPCCVGKLNRSKLNPYIYHATGSNNPTVTYPQSNAFGNLTEADWNALAKAADYSDWVEMRLPRNATRRTAKALLETDRLLFLSEKFGYQTALTRMDPWEASPKHDVLLGWLSDDWSPFKMRSPQADEACNADIQLTLQYLFDADDLVSDSAEWTISEVEMIRAQLEQFVRSSDRQYSFAPRMGGRLRKLIHYTAQQMGLKHWGQGKTDGDKTVFVGKSPEWL